MCSSPLQQTPSRKGFSLWVIFILLVGLLAGVGTYFSVTSESALVKPVQDQLKALKAEKITQAYFNYTSKDFQTATSLMEFKKFLEKYPALTENQSYSFNLIEIEDNIRGILRGILISTSGGSTPVEYQLEKENDEWKIRRIEVGPQDHDNHGDPALLKEISIPIKEQLNALKEKDFVKAYEDYASHDFKQATPIDTFELFVGSYPILTNFEKFTITNSSGNGDRASASLLLSNSEGAVPIEYRLVKEGDDWKIWSMRLILPQNQQTDSSEEELSALLIPIQEQLEALRQGDIDAAYANVSKGFKNATSLASFQSFINNFPIFNNNQARLKEHFANASNAKLKMDLANDEESVLIEYTLVKEDDAWKVLGIQILGEQEPSNVADQSSEFDSSLLSDTIEKQLKALRQRNYTEAYNDYTSEAFKKATSLEDFMKFINNYPIFSENAAGNFGQLMFNNNIGTFRGMLTSTTGESGIVEYDMIKEDGMWKVLSIKILTPKENADTENDFSRNNSSTQLNTIELGDAVDAKGAIIKPTTKFTANHQEIYATLHINKAQMGEKVRVELRYLSNGAGIPPVTTTLSEEGKAKATFVFSPPQNGWPSGEYQIKATTTSGAEKKQRFTISAT